jgi:hypothetical protein
MIRSASFLFLVLFIFLGHTPSLRAAVEKDLGQSLAYFRVTDARADQGGLVDTIARRPMLVIDLRGLASEADFVTALHAALAKPPAPHAVRIVLINSTTATSVVAALDDDALLSVITLAPRSPGLAADIQTTTTIEEDRRALTAFANGTPVEKLIDDTRDKRRYDEAKLVHDHVNGITPASDELPADADDDAVTSEPAKEKKTNGTEKKAEQPPRDLVLERAVQLHRALLALKKI